MSTNGKGDKSRVKNTKKYVENFDLIDWKQSKKKLDVKDDSKSSKIDVPNTF